METIRDKALPVILVLSTIWRCMAYRALAMQPKDMEADGLMNMMTTARCLPHIEYRLPPLGQSL